MILTHNLQTALFKQSTLKINHVYIFHYLFKSVGGTTKYENPGENTGLGCTTPQITVDNKGIPICILLFKTPTLCWILLGGTLIQVSVLRALKKKSKRRL